MILMKIKQSSMKQENDIPDKIMERIRKLPTIQVKACMQ